MWALLGSLSVKSKLHPKSDHESSLKVTFCAPDRHSMIFIRSFLPSSCYWTVEARWISNG